MHFISDQTMQGPALCLVLISCLATAEQYSGTETRGVFPVDVGSRLYSVGTIQSNSRIYKRTIPASFRTAWAELLKTTHAFTFRSLSGLFGPKRFVKVGTTEDAVADFKSLISKLERSKTQHTLVGKAGDLEITLYKEPHYPSTPMITVRENDRAIRRIMYVKTPEEAQKYLNY